MTNPALTGKATCLAVSDDATFVIAFDGSFLGRGFVETLAKPEARVVAGTPEGKYLLEHAVGDILHFLYNCEKSGTGWEVAVPTEEMLAGPFPIKSGLSTREDLAASHSSYSVFSEYRSTAADLSYILSAYPAEHVDYAIYEYRRLCLTVPDTTGRDRLLVSQKLNRHLRSADGAVALLDRPLAAARLLAVCCVESTEEHVDFVTNVARAFRAGALSRYTAENVLHTLGELHGR